MSWLTFIRLMMMIFGKDNAPDLKKIEGMGLLAVKIAQMYALRIDFLNPEKCQHLSQLYRQNTPLSADDFQQLYEQKASQKLKADIDHLDLEPLATASIGQVHRARLKGGDEVVIKIIKSDFREHFVRDVKRLRRFVHFCVFFYPKLKRVADPLGTLDQIEHDTLNELDLAHEAAGTKTLSDIADQYRGRFDLSALDFTKVYDQYTTADVLVTAFHPGKTFDEELTNKNLSYDQLLQLFRIHGLYLFVAGRFHGDIHPGNILLHEGRITFVDNSNIAQVHGNFGQQLLTFFEHLGSYEYAKCAEVLHEMSQVQLKPDPFERFKEAFIELYQDFTDKTVSEISLTKKMMQTVKLAVHHGMVFESGMFAIIKSLMYLDGMVLACNPDAILLSDMKPFIQEFKAAFPAPQATS